MGLGLSGTNQSQFYNPSWFGGSGDPYRNATPVGQTIFEQSIPTAFYAYKSAMGVPDDNSAWSRWVNQQLQNYTLGYNSYSAANPITANLGDYNSGLGSYDDW